jgi:zinc/manganese transport system substrate-binding protein
MSKTMITTTDNALTQRCAFSRRRLLAGCLMLLGMMPSARALEVFACEPEWGSLVQALAGDKANVYVATSALQDVHAVEAKPSLIAKLRRADLLVCAGAELEIGWLPQLQRQASNAKVQGGDGVFFAAEFVETLERASALDRAFGDVHPQGNPHLHLDPHRVQKVALALTERLSRIDVSNAAHYQLQSEQFQQRWTQATASWEQQAASLKGRAVVVQHGNFTYLLHWLGMTAVATLEPKPGLPPTTSHLTEVLQRLQSKPAEAVLNAAYQDPRPALWLAERAQLPVLTLPYTVGGNKQSNDLFSLYDNTLQILLAAPRAPAGK